MTLRKNSGTRRYDEQRHQAMAAAIRSQSSNRGAADVEAKRRTLLPFRQHRRETVMMSSTPRETRRQSRDLKTRRNRVRDDDLRQRIGQRASRP